MTHVFLDAARIDLDATRIISARRCNARESKPYGPVHSRFPQPAAAGPAEQKRPASATDAALTTAAATDPDNPPLSAEDPAGLEAAHLVRAMRARAGLSKARFARANRSNVARLRDMEQRRTRPDSVLIACLAVIDREPAALHRVWGRRARSPA